MKKRISFVLAVTMAISMLAGCGIEEKFVVSDDGNVKAEATIYMTAEEKAAFEELGELTEAEGMGEIEGPIEKNGVNYYYIAGSVDNYVSDTGLIINAEKFYMYTADAVPTEEGMTSDLSFEDVVVTMPNPIVKTNGKLSADKKTVSWDMDALNKNTEIYAFTTENPTENPISIKIGKAKYVKAKKAYTIDTKDDISVLQVDDIFVSKSAMANDTYLEGINITGKKIKFEKTGTYKFTIWTTTNKQSFKIKVDGTAPTVSGVKNNKTYKKAVTIKFSDKHSGVKKATLNGKTIKSGKKVKKNGKYKLVVTDKVGNTKTVKFRIKKK